MFVSDQLEATPTSLEQATVSAVSVECNWGRLTMEAVLDGFPQGPHASDPSGDGFGPGTLDEPRAGLANVIEQGNLQALCELVSGG